MASAVLSTQLLISATVLVVIMAIVVFNPVALTHPGLFFGLTLVFLVTGAAALVPWGAIPRVWGITLPIANILAIALVRDSSPDLAAGVLLVFPVLWLARSFDLRATASGVALAVGLLWLSRVPDATPVGFSDFGDMVLLPITLAFVATTGHMYSRRTRAQSALLRQHSAFIESALDKARRQEHLLVEVLDAVDFGVIAFDRARTVTFVNRAQRRSLADFGAPVGSVVHPVVFEADRTTPFAAEAHPFARAKAGQAFDNVVMWVGSPGQRQAAYQTSARVIRDRQGAYDGGVLVVHDVTRELEAVRARDDLVGSVSHELRSPLTSIMGYLDLARDEDDLSDETRHMIDVAYTNSERLLALVTDLLRAASESGRSLPMTFIRCDLAQIVADSVEAHQVLADEHDVELRIDASHTAVVSADPMRLRQVVDNLITNAIKYNREWGEVVVRLRPDDSIVRVEIEDTGQGIPEEDLGRIFDRYYRTKSARTSKAVGSGLGLAITREIVNRHGGDLSVSSELGIGSVFTATVPMVAVDGGARPDDRTTT